MSRLPGPTGFSTTPILYCGGPFYPDFVEEEAHDGLPAIPSILKPENYHLADEFFDDVYQAVGSEPGLLFWDIANEPGYHTPNFVTFYPEEPEFRHLLDPSPRTWRPSGPSRNRCGLLFRHAIAHVREKDPVNALGVGNTYAYEIEPSQTAPLVDVLIFHNYFETRKRVRDECEIMKRLSQKYNKPVVNNECCCLCRSNPYDMELEILGGIRLWLLRVRADDWPEHLAEGPRHLLSRRHRTRPLHCGGGTGLLPQPGALRHPGGRQRGGLGPSGHPPGHRNPCQNRRPLPPAHGAGKRRAPAGGRGVHRQPAGGRPVRAHAGAAHGPHCGLPPPGASQPDEIRTWLYQLVQQLREVCCILGSGESNSRI